ncbi:MAG: DHA2 family efflux MFS transporter permease subunit [Chloroflexi bacterium]|nr:DHA2 family efflux MFS transporter permease subunit [Chloroflexota bacterium]
MNSQTRGWTLALTSLAFFMVALDALVVVTALPAIHHDIGASLSALQWTVNAYTLAFAAGIITAAAAGDALGRRRVFAVGLGLFTAASAACGVSPSAEFLIAARTVQGLAAAMIMPLSLTLLTAAFPAERRGAIVGMWGGIAGLAVASGPLVGGAVTQSLGWEWVFWINVPIGILATLFTLTRLPETRGPAMRLDLPAVALISAGSVAAVLGLVRAADAGWLSVAGGGTVLLGLALLAGFVAWELRAADPMLPMRLFHARAFSAGNSTSFFMSASQFSAAFLIAQFFQLAQGESPFGAGLRVLPWTLTPLFIAPLAGALSDRVGRRPLMATGMFLQGAGFAAFAALAGSTAGYWLSIGPLVVAGIGVSMVLPVTPAAVLSAVAPADMGRASAVNSTLQRFGSAFGVAVITAVFAGSGSLASAPAFMAGFRPALVVAAALSILGAFCALAIGGRGLAAAPRRAEMELAAAA